MLPVVLYRFWFYFSDRSRLSTAVVRDSLQTLTVTPRPDEVTQSHEGVPTAAVAQFRLICILARGPARLESITLSVPYVRLSAFVNCHVSVPINPSAKSVDASTVFKFNNNKYLIHHW